jgi:hypothetical protein
MTINEIISNVIAGGLLGSLGQGVRIAVGLKKLNDSNTAKVAQGTSPEQFSTGRLVISIFIGFVAGAIGMLVKGSTIGNNGDYNTEGIVTIIAIGYSGADFIEGVFNTYINKFSQPAGTGSDGNVGNTQPSTLASSSARGYNEQPVNVPDEANFDNTPAQG